MSGGGRAPSRPAQAVAAPGGGGGGGQILPPLRRHLAFASTKPSFVPSDDYHRFSGDGRRVADQEPEAIVVRSPVSRVCMCVLLVFFFLAEFWSGDYVFGL